MFHRLFWSFMLLGLVPASIEAQQPAATTAATTAATATFLLGPATFGKDIPISAQEKVNRQLLNGLGAGGGIKDPFSLFTVTPFITILDQVKIEEGKQVQPMIKVNLRLLLSHLMTGDSLDAQDFTLTGTGTTIDECMNKAFSPLRSQPIMLKASTGFRQKMADYYTKNCSAVISRAAAQAVINPTEAFVTLHAIPAGYPCSAEGQAARNDYFQKAQSKECQQKLKQAGAAVSEGNWSAALRALAQVDAAAPCFPEAKAQVAVLESKVDEVLKKRYEWLFKFCKDGTQADVARSNAMNAWALGYLHDLGKQVILK